MTQGGGIPPRGYAPRALNRLLVLSLQALLHADCHTGELPDYAIYARSIHSLRVLVSVLLSVTQVTLIVVLYRL